MENLEETRVCPACSRRVPVEVPICVHCTHDVRGASGREKASVIGGVTQHEHAAGLAAFAKASMNQKQLLQSQQDELMPFWKAWLRLKIVRFLFLAVVGTGLIIAGRIYFASH
jgi:hypothetical protein